MKYPLLRGLLLCSMLVMMGCPASQQNKSNLLNPTKPLPKLRFEQDLEQLMTGHGRGIMFRVKMGPWKQFTNALNAIFKQSTLGPMARPYGETLTQKGALHLMFQLNRAQLSPKDESLYDFKRPAWIKLSRVTAPTASDLIDQHFLLLLPEDTPGGVVLTLMLPSHDPKKAIEHLAKSPSWFGYDHQHITWTAGQRHVLMEVDVSRTLAAKTSMVTSWRSHKVPTPTMTPALAHWYHNTQSPLAVHISTEALLTWGLLGGAQEGTQALLSAVPSVAAKLALQVVNMTTQMASMLPDQLRMFEDHTMVLQTNKTQDIVVDWHATRTAAGRRGVGRWFGEPVMLPAFSDTILKDREHTLLRFEASMNLGAMKAENKNLANLGLSKLKGDDFLRFQRRFGPIYTLLNVMRSPQFGLVGWLEAILKKNFDIPLPRAVRVLVALQGQSPSGYVTAMFALPKGEMKKLNQSFMRIPMLNGIKMQHNPGQGIVVQALIGSGEMSDKLWGKSTRLNAGSLQLEFNPKRMLSIARPAIRNFWRLPHRLMLTHQPNPQMHTMRLALTEQKQIVARPLTYLYTPTKPKGGCGDMLVVSQRQFVESLLKIIQVDSNNTLVESEMRLREIDEQMAKLDKHVDVCALNVKNSQASKARARAIAGFYLASLRSPPTTDAEREKLKRERALLGDKARLLQNVVTAKYGNKWLQYACSAKIKRACETKIVLAKPTKSMQTPAPTTQPTK